MASILDEFRNLQRYKVFIRTSEIQYESRLLNTDALQRAPKISASQDERGGGCSAIHPQLLRTAFPANAMFILRCSSSSDVFHSDRDRICRGAAYHKFLAPKGIACTSNYPRNFTRVVVYTSHTYPQLPVHAQCMNTGRKTKTCTKFQNR